MELGLCFAISFPSHAALHSLFSFAFAMKNELAVIESPAALPVIYGELCSDKGLPLAQTGGAGERGSGGAGGGAQAGRRIGNRCSWCLLQGMQNAWERKGHLGRGTQCLHLPLLLARCSH